MIVWMRAPPSASWVPMVCLKRCAVMAGRPAGGVDQTGGGAGSFQGQVE